MFVGCSDISISVKHVQNMGTIRGFFVCFGDLVTFFSASRIQKIAGLWFASKDQYPG